MRLRDYDLQQTVVAFLRSTAAVWWFSLVRSATASGLRINFRIAVPLGLVAPNFAKWAPDGLSKHKEPNAVNWYPEKLCDIFITIPGISNELTVDRFTYGLSRDIHVQVPNSQADYCSVCAQVSLSIYTAICRAKHFSKYIEHPLANGDSGLISNRGPTVIRIENVFYEKLTQMQREHRKKIQKTELASDATTVAISHANLYDKTV